MPNALSQQIEDNIVSMLRRGCSHREIANTLHVSVGSVHNFCEVHVSNVDCSRGSRPRKLNRTEEQRCVLEMVRGRMDTCENVARSTQQVLGMRVSSHTIKHELHGASLCSQTNVKNPHLSSKNVKARLEFARVHKHWTVEDWNQIIFSNKNKINPTSIEDLVMDTRGDATFYTNYQSNSETWKWEDYGLEVYVHTWTWIDMQSRRAH